MVDATSTAVNNSLKKNEDERTEKFHVGYKDLMKIFVWSTWCTEANNAQKSKHDSHNWKKNLKIMKMKLCTINRTALLIQHWKHFSNIKEFIETFRHKICCWKGNTKLSLDKKSAYSTSCCNVFQGWKNELQCQSR